MIGNLIFTPVKDEKPQMSPENKQSTARKRCWRHRIRLMTSTLKRQKTVHMKMTMPPMHPLQSVTTETLSPDKPLENIASAADTGTENTSAATAGDRRPSIQTPQVQTPLTTATQQKQERFPEPAGMQSVQQATTEPTAEDKTTRERCFRCRYREENASVATADTGEEKASATTADNQSTQAEEHPRSEDTPETSPPTRPGYSTPPQRSLKNKCRSPWPPLTTGAHLRKISTLTLRGPTASQHRQRGDKHSF